MTLLEGNQLKINCSATGFPLPTILISFNEKNLFSTLNFTGKLKPNESSKLSASSGESATIRINYDSQISMEFVSNNSNAGIFSCKAVNEFGIDNVSTTIEFISRPSFDTNSAKNETINVVEGMPAILKCSAFGRPKPKINWQMSSKAVDDKRFRIVDGGRKLILFSVNASDEGKFDCLAKNVVGEIKRTTELVVSWPPKINSNEKNKISKIITVNRHNSLELECPISGKPAPKVNWMKMDDLDESSDKRTSFNISTSVLVRKMN